MLLLTLNICSHYSEEVYVRIKQSGVLAQHKILLNQPAPEYKGRAQFDVQLPPWRNSAGNSPVNSEKATGLMFPVSCMLQAWTILLTSGVWNLVMSALNFFVLCHLNKCPQPKDVELSNKEKKKQKIWLCLGKNLKSVLQNFDSGLSYPSRPLMSWPITPPDPRLKTIYGLPNVFRTVVEKI